MLQDLIDYRNDALHWHHVTLLSHNGKTGPITITRTNTTSCPPSCPAWLVCYDKQGNGRIHRTNVDSKKYKTLSVLEFFESIRKFSRVYRHNEGGDLWNGETREHINADLLSQFVEANAKFRTFPIIYTHKAIVGPRSTQAIRSHNHKAIVNADAPFAINVSVESLDHVDQALALGHDVVTILPSDVGKGVTRTPNGNRVVTCPATYSDVQCSPKADKPCGSGNPLCLRKGRDYAVGFPIHGALKKKPLRILNQI